MAQIAGKPMIRHVYERAVSCPELADVCIATDDERIITCVNEFGGRSVMTAKDHHSGTDRIFEAASKMRLEKEDIIVNIQGDQPLFNQSMVSLLVRPLIENSSVPMATLKWKIPDEKDVGNPNHVKVVTDRNGFAIYFSRCPIPFFRDDKFKSVYFKHLGFYSFRMEFLEVFTRLPQGKLESAEKLEQLRALENGFRIKVVESPYNSIEVDVPGDIGKIEEVLTR